MTVIDARMTTSAAANAKSSQDIRIQPIAGASDRA
jgi:hypothetical protein